MVTVKLDEAEAGSLTPASDVKGRSCAGEGALARYIELVAQFEALDIGAADYDEVADPILGRLDLLWFKLSLAEREEVNARYFPSPPAP